jgi:hypothetical protein
VEEGQEVEEDVLDPVIFRHVDEAGGRGAPLTVTVRWRAIALRRVDTHHARVVLPGRARSVGLGSGALAAADAAHVRRAWRKVKGWKAAAPDTARGQGRSVRF